MFAEECRVLARTQLGSITYAGAAVYRRGSLWAVPLIRRAVCVPAGVLVLSLLPSLSFGVAMPGGGTVGGEVSLPVDWVKPGLGGLERETGALQGRLPCMLACDSHDAGHHQTEAAYEKSAHDTNGVVLGMLAMGAMDATGETSQNPFGATTDNNVADVADVADGECESFCGLAPGIYEAVSDEGEEITVEVKEVKITR